MSETVPLVERARLSAVHSVQCRQVATDKTTKFLYKTIKHLVLLYIICYNIFIDYKYESGNNCYIINTVVHVYFTDFNTCFFFFLSQCHVVHFVLCRKFQHRSEERPCMFIFPNRALRVCALVCICMCT